MTYRVRDGRIDPQHHFISWSALDNTYRKYRAQETQLGHQIIIIITMLSAMIRTMHSTLIRSLRSIIIDMHSVVIKYKSCCAHNLLSINSERISCTKKRKVVIRIMEKDNCAFNRNNNDKSNCNNSNDYE